MSKSNENVTAGGKKRVKISDVNESSQNTRFRSDDMSTSRPLTSKDTCPKSSVDEFFDSGIQSESNLSSGVISEADLKYENSSTDCVYDSGTLSTESLDGGRAEYPSSDNYKWEIADSMSRLDSGIDIDLSDRHSSADLSSQSDLTKTKITRNSSVHQNASHAQRVDPLLLIFQPDEDGNTQLHLAIIQGYEDHVMEILHRHVPSSHYLNIQNYYRHTCLHLSVMLNRPLITRQLLLAGAKTGIEDRNGNTPLHLACEMNFSECVMALLSPVTAYEKTYKVVQYEPVIDSPHQYINEYNYDGLSSIHMAATHPDRDLLHQLFLNGGDVNIRECKGGYTILHDAVISGNISLVTYILQHSGIDVDRKNYARLTPYQLSACHPRIAKILLDKGARQLFLVDDESDDDDYSSDESDDDLYDNPSVGSSRINQVTDMISSLSTNDSAIVSTS